LNIRDGETVKMFCLKLELKIKLFGLNSLKDKRSIVKNLTNRLRKKYNISIIEGNFNDSKNHLEIYISSVSKNKDYLLDLIEQIEQDIELMFGLEVEGEDYIIF